MADNPVLDYSDTVVYERGRLPRGTDGEAIQQAGQALLGLYKGAEEGRLQEDLAAADEGFLKETAQAEGEIEDVIQQETANVDPEFQEAVRQLTKFQLMKDQGIGDANALNIRREHVLRQWTARHPDWAGDLLQVARDHVNGSSLGEAIAKARGPANPLDDVETHARQLGVDMSLRFSDPVAFSLEYVKATKAASKVADAQRALTLLQTTQASEKGLAERSIQQVFDQNLGQVVSARINDFSDQILSMADSPGTAGEAERMNAIRAAARAEKARAVEYVTRQSNGTISVSDAPSRVAQIAQLDAIIDAANPSELAAVVSGIKGVREAEIEGWYAAHPGAAVAGEQLRILGQLGNSFPGLTQRKEQLTEAARLSSYFLGMDSTTMGSNRSTGVNIPRTDSLGIAQESTNAARSTYNATLAAARGDLGPQYSDRHMLNLADEWEHGTRPSKRTVDLARQYMASEEYKGVVNVSGLPARVREDRASKITNMLVGELAEDTPSSDGVPLMWTRAFGGLQWSGDSAVLLAGGSGINPDPANREIGPYLTTLVKSVAHASGLSYEQAAERVWALMQEKM